MPLLATLELDWSQWSIPFTQQWWQETTCSVLVGIACGVLGCYVVLRRMALIGDALAHAVLPGVVIAFLVTGNTGISGLFLGALIAGLVTAGLIKLVSSLSRAKEDSAIGIVFTAFFAIGIVLIEHPLHSFGHAVGAAPASHASRDPPAVRVGLDHQFV